MHFVEGIAIKAIARRTGARPLHLHTVLLAGGQSCQGTKL